MLKASYSKANVLINKERFVIEYKGRKEPEKAWRFHSGHSTEDKMNDSFDTLKKLNRIPSAFPIL